MKLLQKLALLAGAALSVTGVLFQCMLRDPLAEPYTMGVSAGASVGAIAGSAAGHAGMGAGIGAVGGAAAGLAGVLLSHGPDLVLPKGTTFEMVLDRTLRFEPHELEVR